MLDIAIASCTGLGARTTNEDALRHGHAGAWRYAVLSDGAGGHGGGAVASDYIARSLALLLQSADECSPQALSLFVMRTHAGLCAMQPGREGTRRMVATLVALWLDPGRAHALWTHVGDSRLYLLRQGRVRHVTRDDSVVQQMVDAGYLSADEARDHPHKNMLVGAIGIEGGVEPHTIGTPFPLRDGDAFLLCSDGWWSTLDDAAIELAFAAACSADDWLVRMRSRVLDAKVDEQDNFSAIAVWVGEPALVTRAGAG
jgi:serine/threonine protein phosphatase PrpC